MSPDVAKMYGELYDLADSLAAEQSHLANWIYEQADKWLEFDR